MSQAYYRYTLRASGNPGRNVLVITLYMCVEPDTLVAAKHNGHIPTTATLWVHPETLNVPTIPLNLPAALYMGVPWTSTATADPSIQRSLK
jgi:hypothetical protein